MKSVFNVLKWLFGALSLVLSVLLLLYLGIKDENWTILTSDGQVAVSKTAGICLIVVWAVVGALYLLFEFLYKREKNKAAQNNE